MNCVTHLSIAIFTEARFICIFDRLGQSKDLTSILLKFAKGLSKNALGALSTDSQLSLPHNSNANVSWPSEKMPAVFCLPFRWRIEIHKIVRMDSSKEHKLVLS